MRSLSKRRAKKNKSIRIHNGGVVKTIASSYAKNIAKDFLLNGPIRKKTTQVYSSTSTSNKENQASLANIPSYTMANANTSNKENFKSVLKPKGGKRKKKRSR